MLVVLVDGVMDGALLNPKPEVTLFLFDSPDEAFFATASIVMFSKTEPDVLTGLQIVEKKCF